MYNCEVNIMSELYKRIEALCKQKGVSITQMCKNCGASRGSLGDLANNRIQSLSSSTIQKIASYFNVSTDLLLGNETNHKREDKDIRRIQRMKQKASAEDWEKFMKIAEVSFDKYFSDDFIDDDTDE